MLQTAGVHTIAEFSNTQVVDACAYIAANAIARLREAALAQENGWLDVVMPDYTRTHCVRQGNAVLEADASPDARVLESDDVNRLVRALLISGYTSARSGRVVGRSCRAR